MVFLRSCLAFPRISGSDVPKRCSYDSTLTLKNKLDLFTFVGMLLGGLGDIWGRCLGDVRGHFWQVSVIGDGFIQLLRHVLEETTPM